MSFILLKVFGYTHHLFNCKRKFDPINILILFYIKLDSCNRTEDDCDLKYVVNDLRDKYATCKLKKMEIMKNSPCTCNLNWEPHKIAKDYEIPATAEVAYDGQFKLNIKWSSKGEFKI